MFFPASVLLLLLVAITGHFGGNLTHGSTYLVDYAPQPLRALAGLAPRRVVTSVHEADPFEDVVGRFFQARCGGCHNADKRESGLNLTSYQTAMRGGDSGKVIVKGDTEQSELLRRISLPHDDDEFMPAEGKTPLNRPPSRDRALVDRSRRADRRHDRLAQRRRPRCRRSYRRSSGSRTEPLA